MPLVTAEIPSPLKIALDNEITRVGADQCKGRFSSGFTLTTAITTRSSRCSTKAASTRRSAVWSTHVSKAPLPLVEETTP
jgi:hypothetical protein